MSTAVAFVLKGYPRLSETFIAQEILALERRGLDIRLFALRRPTDPAVHPVHREIRANITYLPEYLHREPLRVIRAWSRVRRKAGCAVALRTWLRDFARDPTVNRIRRFGQALVLANELPNDVGWLHAHFLHTPASVTRYAALMVGLPWSVSAHAKDIWTTPEWEKREKLAASRWLVTCTRCNLDHLSRLAPEPKRVDLVYHGLDLRRFPPPLEKRSARDGRDPSDPAVVLSIGRAVEKKGFEILLKALALLPKNLHWRFVHIGEGSLLAKLKQQAAADGIGERVAWMGAQPQETVLAALRTADVFALASHVARDGDRDGLPNALMEAQSQGLACLSTRVSAVPELILDGQTGVLVPPDDAPALTAALARLIRSPVLRAGLGVAGQERVRTMFSMEANIERLALRFGLDSAAANRCASPSTRR